MTKARLFMTRQSGGPPTRRIPLRGIGGGYPARSRHGGGGAFEAHQRGPFAMAVLNGAARTSSRAYKASRSGLRD